ncbi:hypothetical protein SPRG_10304 [Saprolegnia parasitica CBS 223.65]|uniref:Kinesin motor domain-containing protein n=1 Tax=Saprolegnia parasitica (strain CBS 223.65) TaxID=695850 RepID=A0A067C1R8_SAPPC|nr:hypothetical protein SPRG_10304 [Saprolegnia parasitica CBS 223.65]KDO24488.1 hypothetical protein SPRG_10304 [Saprolegnia parasitica CBS 223.65]|eukprot:XP_012204754.1 hypothetical protein SPRG_10304 [Saprolegnia parasitica CBS 223.65]
MGDGHGDDDLDREVHLTLATLQGQGQGTEEDKAMTEALLEGATRVSIATILRRRASIGDADALAATLPPPRSMAEPGLCKPLDFSDTTSEYSEISWATDDSFAMSSTTDDVKQSPKAAEPPKRTTKTTSRIGTVARGASSAIPVRDTNASRSRASTTTARAAAASTTASTKTREQRQSLPVGATRASLLRAPTAIAAIAPPAAATRATPPSSLPAAVPRSASVRARTMTKASPKGSGATSSAAAVKRGSIAAAVDLAFSKEPAPAKTPSARQPRLSLPSRLVPPSVVLTEPPPPPTVLPPPTPAPLPSPPVLTRAFSSSGNDSLDANTVRHAYKTIFTTEKEIEEALASVVPRSMDLKVRIESQDKYIRRLKCRLRDLHMQKEAFASTCQTIERDLTNVHAEAAQAFAALRQDEPKAGEPSGPEASSSSTPSVLDHDENDPVIKTLDSSMQEFVRTAMERNTQNIVAKYQAQWLEKEKAHELHLAQLRDHYTAQVSKVTHDAWATVATQASQRKALESEKTQLELQWTQLQIDHTAVKKELSDLQEKWRLQDEENTTAKSFGKKIVHVSSQLAKANEVVASKEKDTAGLHEAVLSLEAKLAEVDAERHAWTDQVTSLKASLAEEKSRREHFQLAQDQLASDNTALYAQMVAVQTGCEARLQEMKAAYEKKMHSVADEEMRMLQTENRVLSRALASATPMTTVVTRSAVDDSEFKKLTEDFFEARTQLAAQTSLVVELERQVHEGNILRRQMHNTIQELRGNVRVHVRLRPFLPSDGDYEKLKTSWVVDEETSVISSTAKTSMRFSFDKLFGQTHGQDDVFGEVSDFIQSAIDGYHVCIFAYGQTGSGKTYTMQGGRRPEMRGIIPRSMNLIMGCCATLLDQGWEYTLEVTYMEIYNETIRDLLAESVQKYTIRTDKNGKITSTVSFDIMERAACNRSVEKTDMNAESSRSHSIFTLHLRGSKRDDDGSEVELLGSLSLVDLAGSERLSRSGATGDRLKEAQAINKSLSSLADVFSAIAKKQNHIPYRNSKLTYVLQPALSGDGKTLMMVNLSPTDASIDESLCSLRFATQVNQCELGAAGRQVTKREARPEMDIGNQTGPSTPPKGKAPRLSLPSSASIKALRKPAGRAIDAS